jgi:hypothetical protein
MTLAKEKMLEGTPRTVPNGKGLSFPRVQIHSGEEGIGGIVDSEASKRRGLNFST